jgi:hypothetical protein
VVDAMERDMGTTIATKANLQILKQDLTSSINELRQEVRNEIGLVRKDMEIMSEDRRFKAPPDSTPRAGGVPKPPLPGSRTLQPSATWPRISPVPRLSRTAQRQQYGRSVFRRDTTFDGRA